MEVRNNLKAADLEAATLERLRRHNLTVGLVHGVDGGKQHRPLAPARQHRLDFAWPDLHVGLEVQGGINSPKSGHRSISGYLKDTEKWSLLAGEGWLMVYACPPQIRTEDFIDWVAQALHIRGYPVDWELIEHRRQFRQTKVPVKSRPLRKGTYQALLDQFKDMDAERRKRGGRSR